MVEIARLHRPVTIRRQVNPAPDWNIKAELAEPVRNGSPQGPRVAFHGKSSINRRNCAVALVNPLNSFSLNC